jgi:DNA-binding GntR family transcriptional regulator
VSRSQSDDSAEGALGLDGWIALTRQLEQDIALGRLKPRERLVEGELMLRFGVKRNAVRQALSELESMGVVLRPPNKGAVVRDFNAKEIENLYMVRELLETKALEMIPFPVHPDSIRSLREIHDRHRQAVGLGELEKVFRENLAFHRKLFSFCDVPDLVEAIEIFQMKSHAIRSFSIANAKLLARATEEHEAMIDALEQQDREALVRLSVAHIQPAKNLYLEMNVRH